MFDCNNPECTEVGNTLVWDDSDSRQEWSEEFYHCPKCGHEYTHRVEYKIQSHLIESDTLTNNNTGVIE
jgi:DNA-directed RNA polymerase subunit M/transcription elongation factor TFIIS